MAASMQVAGSGNALASALRKAKWRILPLLSCCYLVAYMDRANIAFAAPSMNHDLHFSPKMYGLGAGLFFLSYALCEIPSNMLLLRFGARKWLGRIMLTWGLLAAAMMLVRTAPQFYGARLALGCAEAGYFPGAVYFLSQWFPKAMRARAMAYFYVSLPISTILMGGVAGALLRLNGRLGLRGWQWMFVVEAAPAVMLAAAIWFTLPDTVVEAKWLHPEEKASLATELASDPHSQKNGHGTLLRVLRNPRVWAMGLVFFCALGSQYAVTFSLPLLLMQTTGVDTAHAGYLVAAAGVVGAVAMLVTAWHSDKKLEQRWHIGLWLALMTISPLVAGLHLTGWVAATALLMVPLSWYGTLGPMTSVLVTVVPGEAAALAVGAVNMCAISGGFAGPYFMGWMREATGGYAWGIVLLCLPCMAAFVGTLWLLRDERKVRSVSRAV